MVDKKRYHELKLLGKCTNHSNRNAVVGRTQCKECLIKDRIQHNNYKLKGKCSSHPGRNIAVGHTKCQECLINERNRKIKLNKKGRCAAHPDMLLVPGKSNCKKCVWQNVLLRAHLSDKQATKILEKQNYICQLSGIKLEKGVNASPDHIIPIGKNRFNKNHKLNNISNIQFVDIQVNMSKQDYSDREFIDMCRKVVRYQDEQKKTN